MRRNMLLLGGMCWLLAACATAPGRYYSLADVPAGAPATPSERTASYGLQVQVLGIPAESDRTQLLIRDPAREPAVEILNQSLWAAPLAEQFQAVLAGRVSAALGAPDVRRLPGAADRPLRQMQVRVTRFDLVWGQGADLAAVWSDHGPGAGEARICQARIRVPAETGVDALVDAQRRAVQILAGLMARAGAPDPAGSPESRIVTQAGCT